MSHIEADCSLIKKNDDLVGLSLVAQPQSEAEIFCGSFPRQLVDGKGDISVKDGKVTFVHPTEGSCSFNIESGDSNALQQLLSGEKGKLGIYRDGFLTPGFKITQEGMENEGEKTELTRIH